MKRKLIRQGRSGMTVYLPKKWVDARHLVAGDEVELSEEAGRLVLETEKRAGKIKQIERDITGLDKDSILQTFTALYESGFDEIKFVYKKNDSKDFATGKKLLVSERITSLVQRFHGMEIVSQGDDYYLVKDISSQSDREFDVILRRIFFLLSEFDTYINDGLKEDRKRYDQGKERYEGIIRFVGFCLRLLNKRQVPDAEKYNLYEVINSLNHIALYYRFMADDLEGKKTSDKTKDLIRRMGIVVRRFHDFYYDTNNERLVELNKMILGIENELDKMDVKDKEFAMIYRFSTVQDYVLANMKCVLALKALSKK